MYVVSNFTEPLEIEQTDDGWRLCRELRYEVGREGSGIFVKVPAGFEADGSSIPKIGWPIIGHPLQGRNGPSGFVHDFLYRERVITEQNGTRLCTKAEADGIFHEALQTGKQPRPAWVAWCMWKAVSWFGGWAWRKYRRDEKP